MQWNGAELTELKLHPITLGFGLSMTERGRPKLAEAALARQILDNVVARSQPFNTRIVIEDGVGRVVIKEVAPPSSRKPD